MKKIGTYTARGVVNEAETEAGNPQLVPLFDGRFDTAYRVVDFVVWGTTYTSSAADVIGKLSKNPDGVTSQANFMRADDDNQIAWSGADAFSDMWNGSNRIIDPDNLIVEDLYVYARSNDASGSTTLVNYMITMEKYDISEARGALTMARDRAQGDIL
jgi:hypothetical protein